MKEDSEEARLMGSKTKSSSMVYTDGPKRTLADTPAPIMPIAPPAYEEAVMGALYCHDHMSGMKGSEERPDSELLSDLVNYSGTTLMTQFHADALKQVGYGKYQLMMILIAGLSVAAQAVQIFSLFFILPSADLEFCMSPEQKDLLIAINFMGAAFGAMNTGAIAEINGRKGTLLGCVCCMTLFSVVSVFMPTYGPFAMARFCASACAGGILPISVTYVGEMTPASMRGRSVAMLIAIGLVGGTVATAMSIVLLPMTGEQLMLEHKEHFSAWHQYLLVMTLCSVIPIVGLLSLPESPRWLLDVGREVEALEIYQRIYCANRRNGRYTLTELELPAMRTEKRLPGKSVLSIMTNNAYQFFESFGSLARAPYKNTTYILIIIWFVTMFISYGLAVYILKYGRTVEEHLFNSRTLVNFNNTYENINFTMNIVNQNFASCQFFNCTFDQMFLSYIKFQNCTFLDTNFHGVKTGNTTFMNTFFNNVKFIDTNLGEQNFINCAKNYTEFDQMLGGCDKQYDFNIFGKVDYHANIGWIVPSVIGIIWCGETINRLGRIRMATFCITLATMLCCMVGFLCLGELVYWIVGIVQASILAGLVALSVFSIEYYCTYLRCTALGLFLCFGYFGAVIGARLYSQLPVDDTHIAAVITIAGLSFPSILTTFLRDTSQQM